MKRKLPLLSPVALAVLGASTFHTDAAILFTENFSGYTANSALNTSGVWGTVSGFSPTVRNQTTSTVFGSPNQYGEFFDTSATQGIRVQSGGYALASNAVTTFQFDFYEPSGGGSSTMGVGYARTGDANSDLNTLGRRALVNMGDGTIGGLSTIGTNTYSLDTVYTFYMILNDTASPVAYSGGTLAALTADVWLEQSGGSQFYAGTVAVSNSQTAAYTVGFRTFNSALQNVNIDNVSLFEGAATVVPEPGPTALLGITGGLLLLARRKR